jgi:hypothetical protein
MKNILITKFVEYLRENSPEVLFSLEANNLLSSYVNQKIESISGLLKQLQEEKKPDYIVQEVCLKELTSDLRPSKYQYIKEVLEEDFIKEYRQLLRSGLLRFEISNLISTCHPFFEAFGFSEQNEENKNLRYTIIGTIREYFELSEKEIVRHGLQPLP